MTYLASHPGVAMRAFESLKVFGKERYWKGEPPTYPQAAVSGRKGSVAVDVGQSIAEKRAAICAKFDELKNIRRESSADMRYVEALEKKFEKTFDKATSGYRRGGLWDAGWRSWGQPVKLRPYHFVGDYLNEKNIDRLAPSAKRFTLILDQLIEALGRGQQLMEARDQVKNLCRPLNVAEHANAPGQDISPVETSEFVCRLVEASRQSCELARQALDEASEQVCSDKKHYGKRQIISGCLFGIAAIVGGLSLAHSGFGLALLAYGVATLFRVVGLASIRGFDRDRGWKSIEGLLEATERFIMREGDEMKTDASLAQLRLVGRLVEGQENLKVGVDELRAGQDGLKDRMQILNDKFDQLRIELRGVSSARVPQAVASIEEASSAPSSVSPSQSSTTTSTPVGTPPKPLPAPLLRTQSLQCFTADPTRFA